MEFQVALHPSTKALMKVLLAALACSLSLLTHSQELWNTFPKKLHAGLKIVSDSNGLTFHSQQINGYSGAELQFKQGAIIINEGNTTWQITYDANNPIKHNENFVYYIGIDENSTEHKIYFDSVSLVGNQQTLHLTSGGDSIRTSYYFNHIKGGL